jgi:DNA polymerase delta subunit 1
MSRVCNTFCSDILDRGQQVKVFNQLVYNIRRKGYIANLGDLQKVTGDEGVRGATVINPLTGFFNIPITTLDFNSLYPSIMIAHNLCYSTLLNPKRPATSYTTIDVNNEKQVDSIPNHLGVKNQFVQTSYGVLPNILKDLLGARKVAKKELKIAEEAKNTNLAATQDARQLALKVSANSVYGFTNANMMNCPSITASVTSVGRNMLFKLKDAVEKKFDAIVVYGDTGIYIYLFLFFFILTHSTNEMKIKQIRYLFCFETCPLIVKKP